MLAFHDADTDTDTDTDILADIIARILARMSVSASWNAGLIELLDNNQDVLRGVLLKQLHVKTRLKSQLTRLDINTSMLH